MKKKYIIITQRKEIQKNINIKKSENNFFEKENKFMK